MSRPVLDPLEPGAELAAIADRIGDAELRQQKYEARSVALRPMDADFGVGALWGIRNTTAGYRELYKGRAARLFHPGVFVRFAAVNDVGTTAKARVRITLDSGEVATSDGVDLGSGFSGYYALGFLHLLPLWGSAATLSVQHERTTGAGNAILFSPAAALVDPQACSGGDIGALGGDDLGGGGSWYLGGWLPS